MKKNNQKKSPSPHGIYQNPTPHSYPRPALPGPSHQAPYSSQTQPELPKLRGTWSPHTTNELAGCNRDGVGYFTEEKVKYNPAGVPYLEEETVSYTPANFPNVFDQHGPLASPPGTWLPRGNANPSNENEPSRDQQEHPGSLVVGAEQQRRESSSSNSPTSTTPTAHSPGEARNSQSDGPQAQTHHSPPHIHPPMAHGNQAHGRTASVSHSSAASGYGPQYHLVPLHPQQDAQAAPNDQVFQDHSADQEASSITSPIEAGSSQNPEHRGKQQRRKNSPSHAGGSTHKRGANNDGMGAPAKRGR